MNELRLCLAAECRCETSSGKMAAQHVASWMGDLFLPRVVLSASAAAWGFAELRL